MVNIPHHAQIDIIYTPLSMAWKVINRIEHPSVLMTDSKVAFLKGLSAT